MERLTMWHDGNQVICTDDCANSNCPFADPVCERMQEVIDRLAAYEDTGLTPEAVEHLKLASMGRAIAEIKEFEGVSVDRLRQLAQADMEGRCVALPFPLHRSLIDVSDPERPDMMEDFRISATWTQGGLVFESPWNIFLENIKKGYIKMATEWRRRDR